MSWFCDRCFSLILVNVTSYNILIKCSALKFLKLRDVAHRIRAPYLFYFETLKISDYSDFYWLCFDCT